MSFNALKLLVFFVFIGIGWSHTGWAESIQAAEKARYQANDDFYRALESTPSEQRTPQKIKELEKKHIEPAQAHLRRALKADLDQRIQKYGFKPVTEKEYDQMISKHRSSDAGDEEDVVETGSTEPKKSTGAVQYKKIPTPSPANKPVRSNEAPVLDGSGIRKEIDF